MPLQVLVLCTGNSARSILAEALLNGRGAGRVRAWSAGSHPKPAPHPLAIELLEARGFETSGLRSKSWDEFAKPGAPQLDLVITVCGNAAGETCPMWIGEPIQVHWGVDDPAGLDSAEQRAGFERAFRELEHRIEHFLRLDLDALDHDALRSEVARIAGLRPDEA